MSQYQTVSDWPSFLEHWGDQVNFLMAGDCIPFEYDFPPVDEILDVVRHDEKVGIHPGTVGGQLLVEDIREEFRKLPIEKALEAPFQLGHFELTRFDSPGNILHGFHEKALDPWKERLASLGFTHTMCNPIIFMTGPNAATNYHMDFSTVMATQVYGVKKFWGLKDPDRWAPVEARLGYQPPNLHRPDDLTDQDALCAEMHAGDVLWNALLTPHWVDAGDTVAMSLNISHRGLCREGRYTRNEAQLLEHRRKQEAAS